MEIDDEIQENLTYTPLTNVNLETDGDFKFKFEKFILSGNSDSEEDTEDNLIYSDDSRSEENISNFEYSIQDLPNCSQNFSLTTEDWDVINSSLNPELKKALICNRNVKYSTLQLFNKIRNLLIKNQDKIRTLRKSLEKTESKDNSLMYLGQLGVPYFKTKKEMFCSDPNKDTLDRTERGLLNIYQTSSSSKWSKSECDKLARGVQLTYNLNKQKAVLKEITTLKEKLAKEDEDSEIVPDIIDKIEQLEGEVRNLRAIGINDVPPLSQNEFIDWEHISMEFLMENHNAQECSTFWHIYLHPDINKSNWTREENNKIRLLAEKYNKQDWDRIAVELGTNRSGFSVYIYYSSTLSDQLPKSRFTVEEDKRLTQYVDNRKIGSYIPWNIISDFFPGRTKLQLMHRYKYYLSNLDQYTEGFSDAEDILIILLVDRFGRNYIKFTEYLPTKSYMQIKSRYDNHLRFRRIKGCFSIEEDRKILAHFKGVKHEIGSLAVALNRNRLQIRQRYLKLKGFFNKNPNKSLENIERRCGRKKETHRRLQFLKYIVEQFKNCVDIPTLEDIEKKLGKKKQSKNDHDIDTLLVNFFSTSYTFKHKPLAITTPKITNAADKIYNILKSWRVNLKIPDEMRKNNILDIIDVEILNLLRYRCLSDIYSPSIDELLPPNMNSLVGLRGLLMKNQLFKQSKFKKTLSLKDNLPSIRSDHDTQIATELLNILQSKDISTQCIIQNERSLFLERFVSMFMWPALFSIESPSQKISKLELRLKNSAQSITKKKDENKCKKKPVKRSIVESSNNQVTKKIKLNDAKQQIECNSQKSLQPQRFSTRLKNKKEMSNKNESIENEHNFTTTEETGNSSGVNEIENLNLLNSEQPNQLVEMTEPTSLKINRDITILSKNLNEIRPQNIPPNLVKVDKSEIVKLLQNKKPIKIFKIISVKKPDGTIMKPTNTKITEIVESTGKLTASESSALVPLVKNLKNNLMAKLGNVNKDTNINNQLTDSSRVKNNLSNSNKNKTEDKPFSYGKKLVHLNKSPSRNLESSMKSVDRGDMNKLDAFLKDVENEEFRIDLTDSDVMKIDVEQLDQLIKQESTFDLSF